MKTNVHYCLRALAASIFFAALTGASPTLTVIPSTGALAGAPGTPVGWGLTLNDSGPDYVVLNDSSFLGSNVYGSYKDYVANQFIVAGPSPETSSVMVPFTLNSAGLGEFDIYSTSPAGTVVAGNIEIDFSLFSQYPNSPSFDPNSFVGNGQITDPVQITIGSASATPEPSSFALLGAGGFALVMLVRLRKRGAALVRSVLMSFINGRRSV